MAKLNLDGAASYKYAVTKDGKTMVNVTFVRADGFDVDLWVKGTMEGREVLVPKGNIAVVHN